MTAPLISPVADPHTDRAVARPEPVAGPSALLRALPQPSAGELTTLRAAVARVLAAQGVTKVADLTYDKSIDSIRHSTSGAVGVRPIDWQNRPTFQQVVAIDGHRPR